MTFYILPNNAGDSATSLDVAGGAATATGYDIKDVIAGPRHMCWRSVTSTTARSIGYHFASDFSPTHIVIARAHLLLTQAGVTLTAINKSTGGTWSDLATLSLSTLNGPTSQDLAVALTPQSGYKRGYGISTVSAASASEAMQISKLFFSVGLAFEDPDQSPQWENVAEGERFFIPQNSTTTYEVEKRLSLSWTNISSATVEQFKALAQLLSWPLYLYDDAANVFKHKLEHVLVEKYAETKKLDGNSDLVVSFLRLKHS